MKFVFEKLIDNLFMSHQTIIFFNSVFISSSRVLRSLAEANTFILSANILNDRIFEQFDRSFMYIKNIIGPSELPCGMPQVIVCVEETIFSN